MIRTPKTIYQDKFIMSFHVISKEIYYTIYKWSDDGTNRGSITSGKLGGQSPQQILDSTILSFTSVEDEKK